MKEVIEVADYVLLPLYLGVFIYIIIRIKRKYYTGSVLGKYFMYGFFAKVAGSMLFALLSVYYFQGGDSYVFYTGGVDFLKTIFTDFPKHFHFLYSSASEFNDYYIQNFDDRTSYGYLAASSNLMACKFVSLFGIFCFNKYLLISLCFGTFSFSGMWVSFKACTDNYPNLKKQLSIPFLFLPSILFWGGGILKDTLCIGFLGWLFYAAYLFFIKKDFKVSTFLIFIISLYCLAVLKNYIVMAFLPFLALWIMTEQVQKINSRLVRRSITIFAIVLVTVSYSALDNIQKVVDSGIDYFTEYVRFSHDSYMTQATDDGAFIKLSDIEFTPAGIVQKIPASIVNSLYRPYIWESRKAITLFAAIESLLILLYTIYVLLRTRILGFFAILLRTNMVLFFLFFSLLFAAAVGLTCFNLGTLVRYKIPCIPFYITALVIISGIWDKKQADEKILLEKG